MSWTVTLSLSTDSEKCGQFRTDAAKAKAAAEETKNCPDIRYASCALRARALRQCGQSQSALSPLPPLLTKQSFHCECINHIQANHISDRRERERRGREGDGASCPDSDVFIIRETYTVLSCTTKSQEVSNKSQYI